MFLLPDLHPSGVPAGGAIEDRPVMPQPAFHAPYRPEQKKRQENFQAAVMRFERLL